MRVEDAVQAVHARIPISQVAARYTRLSPAGREMKGCCPLHQEKTPSFFVDDSKGVFICFGCGEGGDVLDLVQKAEKVDFLTALRDLAESIGIRDLETRGPNTRPLVEVMQAAQEFYTSGGEGPLEPLRARGIASETLALYGVGYAPAGGLIGALRARGHSLEGMAEAGLLASNWKTQLAPHLRSRLTIPIRDRRGHIVAFTGRATTPQQQPKYLNTHESPIFRKSELLFGLWETRQVIENGSLVLVEGPLDAMKVTQAGYPGVALLGGSLSARQVELLRQSKASHLLLAFDRDAAGLKLFLQALSALRGTAGVRVVVWEGGKDAGELSDGQIQTCIANSIGVAEFLWRVACRQASEVDARLAWLKPWLTPIGPTDSWPSELADLLRREGIVVRPGQAKSSPQPQPETERLRLLEADIAALLFSVEGLDTRLKLVEDIALRVMPTPGSLLAPVLEALSQRDPLLHLRNLGGGNIFYRRVMEAPSLSLDEIQARLKELVYRHERQALEGYLEQLRTRLQSEGGEEVLEEIARTRLALEGLRRSRLTFSH